MRITLGIQGGVAYFPNLDKAVTVDTGAMARDEASRLEKLVVTSRFFQLPASLSTPTARGDQYQYTVTVEDGPVTHTVAFRERSGNEPLDQLVAQLRSAMRKS